MGKYYKLSLGKHSHKSSFLKIKMINMKKNMKKQVNPILTDRQEFERILDLSGIMIYKAMGEEYHFLNEEGLMMYDDLAESTLHWFQPSTLEIPAFKMSILQLMGIIASQEKNYKPSLKDGLGDNVIDFMKYKEFKNKWHKPLIVNTQAR